MRSPPRIDAERKGWGGSWHASGRLEGGPGAQTGIVRTPNGLLLPGGSLAMFQALVDTNMSFFFSDSCLLERRGAACAVALRLRLVE